MIERRAGLLEDENVDHSYIPSGSLKDPLELAGKMRTIKQEKYDRNVGRQNNT